MADDLIFPGGALSSFGTVQQWDNVMGSPDLLGEPQHIPGRAGRVDTPQTPDARDMGVRMLLAGASRPAWTQAQIALSQAVWSPRGAQLVQRTRDLPSGTVTDQGMVRYVSGLGPTMESERIGKVALRLLLLDAYWYDTADTTIAPGTVTVTGDAPTRRMTITLPRAGTLTNSTLGVSVTVTVATILNVEAGTATAGLDTMSWSGDNSFFLLTPGANTITWSGDNAPTGFTTTAVGSGGTFAAGTYYWKVTATNSSGETVGSVEASAAIVLNGSANLAWNAVTGATGYKVYRATAAGGESTSPALVTTITSGSTVTYTDTGTATTAGAVPTGSPSIAYRGAHL